mgnify:CR=1 FL=1
MKEAPGGNVLEEFLVELVSQLRALDVSHEVAGMAGDMVGSARQLDSRSGSLVEI